MADIARLGGRWMLDGLGKLRKSRCYYLELLASLAAWHACLRLALARFCKLTSE